jgi:hypothetical protein
MICFRKPNGGRWIRRSVLCRRKLLRVNDLRSLPGFLAGRRNLASRLQETKVVRQGFSSGNRAAFLSEGNLDTSFNVLRLSRLRIGYRCPCPDNGKPALERLQRGWLAGGKALIPQSRHWSSSARIPCSFLFEGLAVLEIPKGRQDFRIIVKTAAKISMNP